MAKKTVEEILATNVRALMERAEWTEGQLATRAGIDKKTVNNIVNHRNSAQIDSVRAIAKAFGLDAFQLLMENLPALLIADPRFTALITAYTRADSPGRDSILRVAELAARPYRDDPQ